MKTVFFCIFALMVILSANFVSSSESCSELYFESEKTGRIDLAEFNCIWGTPDDKNSLQVSNECGLPKQKNHFMVLTHNWLCDGESCPSGLGWVTNIPMLERSDKALLCDGSRLWKGTVISSRFVDYGQQPMPQTEFQCPTKVCGTIVTSYGKQDATFRAEGFWLVRLSYR